MEVLSSKLFKSKQFPLYDKLRIVAAVALSVVLTRLAWDYQINSLSQKYTSVSENSAIVADGNFPTVDLLACVAAMAGKVFILSCNSAMNIGQLTNTFSVFNCFASEIILCLYWTVKSDHPFVSFYFRIATTQPAGRLLLTWLPRSQLACFVSAMVVLSISRRDAAYNLTGYLAHVCVHFSSLVGLYSGPRAYTLLHVTAFHLTLLYTLTLRVLVEESGSEQPMVDRTWKLMNCYLHINSVGRYLFFITGHRFEFSKLQLSVGFIGNENFHFVYAGICLAINTFGYDVLAILAYHIAALLAMENNVRLPIIDTFAKSLLCERLGTQQRGTLYHVSAVCFLYRITLLCFSCFAAALHRRHLMVWAVFAPKLAFESAHWIIGAPILTFLSFLIDTQYFNLDNIV